MEDRERDRQAERANLETTRRDEMMIQAVRGLLLANGGGAVALLAFLQAVWNELQAPVGYVVVALILMSLGIVSAIGVLLIRYQTSIEHQRENPHWWWWRWGYMTAVLIGLVLFLAAVSMVAIGVWTTR